MVRKLITKSTKEDFKTQIQTTKTSNICEVDHKLSQADIIKKTAGSLKSKVPYKKNEKEIAKNMFVQKSNNR